MTEPTPVEMVDVSEISIAPRFSVEQGTKPGGGLKIRPCDDFTESGANGCIQPSEKISYDGVDSLISAIGLFAQ